MLFTNLWISALALAPSVIATLVFIIFAVRYAAKKKNGDQATEAPLLKKRMRASGVTALVLWVMLGAFNALLLIALRNM